MDLRAIDDDSKLQADETALERAATLRLHRRHHQVVERRCCSGALRLHHCGFGRRFETHLIFLLTCLDVLSQPRGYYDAFADARAGCSAKREWLLPPEGTARAEVFGAFHFIVEQQVGCCCVSVIAGPGVTCKLARHMTAAPILRYFRSMPQVVRRVAALGCCAGQPRCVPFLVEGHCGERKLSRHTPQTRCFTFVWHHSVMRAVICLRFTRVFRCVLQDTSHSFCAFLVGFRSVTPCCLSCFDFGYLGAVTQSVFVRFRA